MPKTIPFSSIGPRIYNGDPMESRISHFAQQFRTESENREVCLGDWGVRAWPSSPFPSPFRFPSLSSPFLCLSLSVCPHSDGAPRKLSPFSHPKLPLLLLRVLQNPNPPENDQQQQHPLASAIRRVASFEREEQLRDPGSQRARQDPDVLARILRRLYLRRYPQLRPHSHGRHSSRPRQVQYAGRSIHLSPQFIFVCFHRPFLFFPIWFSRVFFVVVSCLLS